MDDIFRMQVLQTLDDLVDNLVDEFGVETLLVPLDEVEEIMGKILEDEVDFPLLLEGLLDIDNEIALQHFEHLDLPLDGPPGKLILIRLLELFNCHLLHRCVPTWLVSLFTAFQTIPYAPSSITSII